ncbi:MAG: hypothetical protein ACTSWF_03190, partial [Candidatus Freyarchaeota archaeon]
LTILSTLKKKATREEIRKLIRNVQLKEKEVYEISEDIVIISQKTNQKLTHKLSLRKIQLAMRIQQPQTGFPGKTDENSTRPHQRPLLTKD